MPTPAKGPRLGGGAAHERLMLANLSAALFEHKRITTTVTKAKRLKPYAERLVTFAKRGDLASRRRVLGLISNKGIVHELFTDIAQAVENRDGGYTRITKIGNRKGDNAPMAVIELVLEPVSAKQAVVAEATSAAKRGADKNEAAAAPAAEEAPEAEVVETEAAAAPEAEAEAATEEAPAAEEAATEEAPAAKKAAKAPAAKKKDEDEAK
ncbi:50S ribosomal protein L17 [Pseudarthrobacter sulfonivorans]|uniref:50S ribosomal protein L17 n=1 Tax=Pseudarthrobacter sulfonivorans TaxID=121292 RepID=UPI002866265D|nr:50S ribosomal protein L17 [Pseudarthrobacter sulfonivorans]MDR6413605.1 large subunit ribosomal protein L17 [Pseudarthrobacter sulfonivorans]